LNIVIIKGYRKKTTIKKMPKLKNSTNLKKEPKTIKEPKIKKVKLTKKDDINSIVEIPIINESINIDESILIDEETVNDEPIIKVIVKKGRKPKGGKLKIQQVDIEQKQNQITNIILHLKCSLLDLELYNNDNNKIVKNPAQYIPTVPKAFTSYTNNKNNLYAIYGDHEIDNHADYEIGTLQDLNRMFYSATDDILLKTEETLTPLTNTLSKKDTQMTDINTKLKRLKINLYKNTLPDKKPACFWCTYDFDNPSCYIPKYEMDDKIYGYGAFCRPECAAAYLMKENLDDSMKFERYHLLNQTYAKVYDYKKSIKPAPNPYYLLDKYYGNLTIQEYRKLLRSEHLLLVLEKPLTRILPELHEDNEEQIENIYIANDGNYNTNRTTNHKQSGMYKVKKQSDKSNGPTKSSLLREHFGLMT
jgi:hypothetical protein